MIFTVFQSYFYVFFFLNSAFIGIIPVSQDYCVA